MSFELLANETLYEIFEYLDAVELFRSFYGVNRRFNSILLVYFRSYRVNFLARYYLSLIIKQIVSLRLSDNDDESPS